MKTSTQRINNIIGQLEGVKKMLERDDVDCFKLVIQLKAVRSAMSSLMEKVMAEELSRCLLDKKTTHHDSLLKLIKEFSKK